MIQDMFKCCISQKVPSVVIEHTKKKFSFSTEIRGAGEVLFFGFSLFTTTTINKNQVVCGASVVFGPSLALRGLTKDDVERAVTGESSF